jgi:hypothetical protein
MKRTRHASFLSFLLASLVLASMALAQTTEARQTETEKDLRSGDTISAARSPYTQNAKAEGASRDAGDAMLLAQRFQPRPMPPFRPQRGYPQGSYRTPWMDHGSAGHALIGAAIGFGLGGALGAAANRDHHSGATAGAVVLCGGLGALIGGAIGGSHGGGFAFTHHRRIYRPSGREGEESDLNAHLTGSHSEDRSAEDKSAEDKSAVQTASARPVSH